MGFNPIVFRGLCVLYGGCSVWEDIRAALPVLPISPPAGDGPCDWWLLHRIREYLGCIYLQTYVHIGYHILLHSSTMQQQMWRQMVQNKTQLKLG